MKQKNKYFTLKEFSKICDVSVKTIKKNYKKIPGVEKIGDEFRVLSGTRYPYNVRNSKLDNFGKKRYALLKAISEDRYIDDKIIKCECERFENLLKELLDLGYIKFEPLCNTYGANGYVTTALGDAFVEKQKKNRRKEIALDIAEVSGTFLGSAASQIKGDVKIRKRGSLLNHPKLCS